MRRDAKCDGRWRPRDDRRRSPAVRHVRTLPGPVFTNAEKGESVAATGVPGSTPGNRTTPSNGGIGPKYRTRSAHGAPSLRRSRCMMTFPSMLTSPATPLSSTSTQCSPIHKWSVGVPTSPGADASDFRCSDRGGGGAIWVLADAAATTVGQSGADEAARGWSGDRVDAAGEQPAKTIVHAIASAAAHPKTCAT